MIIYRYLIVSICKPLVPSLAILVALFASYNVAAFLSDAANGLLPASTIGVLVGLKVLISLEVLIPIALYVSVFLALGRLHSGSEFIAMLALRVTPGRVVGAVLTVSAALACIVGALSLVARPFAYQTLHRLSTLAGSEADVDAMASGTFYQGMHGDRVIFLTGRQGPGSSAQDVFVRRRLGDHIQIIHAGEARLVAGKSAGGASQVYLSDAHIYEFGDASGKDDQVLSAGGMSIALNAPIAMTNDESAVATNSLNLARSHGAADVAEFQWRISTPISTLLLGLLGLLMSRGNPRQNRNIKFAAAILIYFAYDLLFTSARTWVQHGTIAMFPGIWWVPAVLSLFLLIAFTAPAKGAEFGRA